MDISLGTPALLFPAISLLMLAYTNRFVVLATLVRKLHEHHNPRDNPVVRLEINHLRFRIRLIRGMQSTGIVSMLLCVCSMMALLASARVAGVVLFVLSLILLAVSLVYALWEILRSTEALELHISDLRKDPPPKD